MQEDDGFTLALVVVVNSLRQAGDLANVEVVAFWTGVGCLHGV
jgi:hypothetical protein